MSVTNNKQVNYFTGSEAPKGSTSFTDRVQTVSENNLSQQKLDFPSDFTWEVNVPKEEGNLVIPKDLNWELLTEGAFMDSSQINSSLNSSSKKNLRGRHKIQKVSNSNFSSQNNNPIHISDDEKKPFKRGKQVCLKTKCLYNNPLDSRDPLHRSITTCTHYVARVQSWLSWHHSSPTTQGSSPHTGSAVDCEKCIQTAIQKEENPTEIVDMSKNPPVQISNNKKTPKNKGACTVLDCSYKDPQNLVDPLGRDIRVCKHYKRNTYNVLSRIHKLVNHDGSYSALCPPSVEFQKNQELKDGKLTEELLRQRQLSVWRNLDVII